MMHLRNFIEIKYDNNGHLTAEITKNGNKKTIRSMINIYRLIDIAKKYGYEINGEIKIVRYSKEIIKEYYKKKKNRINVYHMPKGKTIIKEKKKKGKIIAMMLSGTMTLSALGLAMSLNNNEDKEEDSHILKAEYMVDQQNELDNTTEDEIMNIPPENQTVAEFHYSYEDRSNTDLIFNVELYDDIFRDCAKRYGLDVNLLKAIACQESSGNHYDNIGIGPAEGIMQIEKDCHIDTVVSAFDFESNSEKSIYITEEVLQDPATNIEIGAMDLRNSIEAYNYNIPLGTQAYNFGVGGVQYTLDMCQSLTGINKTNIENNQENNEWLNYREIIGIGDPEYVEHVYSFLPNNYTISVLDRNGNEKTIALINDNVKQITR